MSSRWGGSSESRWSSERERLEQEKRRKEFEAEKPRTRKRPSWREGTASTTPPEPTPPEPAPESPIRERRASDAESGAGAERQATVGRKWRDSVEPPSDDNTGLPNLPGDDDGGSGGPSGKGILIFGAVLFVLMAIFAFLPFGPLGSNQGETPTPTVPVALVPTAAEQDPNRTGGLTSPVVERPANTEFVVCIDPGHGGWDYGRQRQQDNYDQPWFNESEVNLAMAFMLRDELESRGVGVIMTRETGTAVNVFGEDVNNDGRTILDGRQDGDRDELQARINICNAAGADILVSVHLNGHDDTSARGYEVLYTGDREFGARNLDLATAIYRSIGSAYKTAGFETQARGVKDDKEDLDAEMHEFGSEQHLVLTGPAVNNPDYSIVPSNMPGVFIEPVFITNQADANFIVRPENQELLAKSYAEGIMNYFEKYP